MDQQSSTSRNDLECMLLDETAEPKALPLSLLEDITGGFSEHQEIGRGGFAVVYKGTLSNGLMVAVKRLSNCYMQEKEFLREVECLLKVKHKNVVRLLGYCADTQGSVADFDGQVVMADIQQRLLCFEYLPNGSLDQHIKDASTGLEWSKRYQIIQGVCEGLSYLHRKNIFHLDLKPTNILLDSNLVPKISDFGLSRIVEEDKSRFIATKVGGTMGYLAPEFPSHEITHKFDLYSFGVILLEMLTGRKGYQDVESVLESWSNRLDKSQGETRFEQIRVCTEIGIECIDINPEKRPVSIHDILVRLNETGTQVNSGGELLDVQPLVLRFPFEPNKFIPCSLQLTNNTDQHVSFGLMNKSGNQKCFASLPIYGVVPPRSVYYLVVTTNMQEKLPEMKYFDLILESIILGDGHNGSSESYRNDGFFEKAKMLGHVVHGVTMKAICTMHQGIITPKVLRMKIPYKYLRDIHQAKQWIITGNKAGRICIWSYETQRLVASFKVSRKKVYSIKFVERKKWFVAGTKDGFIHVYNYEKMQNVTSFRTNSDGESVISLAIHPTQPYVLSLSANCDQAKLWDWNKGWECKQTFMTEYSIDLQFVFNPVDMSFASPSKDHTVKIWGPDSPESKCTLSGHSQKVNCLEFFTRNDQQYLITGSDDYTAKIWDMQKKTCVHTLEAFMSEVISVFASPNLPILITGSRDSTVYLWSSVSFRVEKVLKVNFHGDICRLSYLTSPQRVVIGYEEAIFVTDIDNISYEARSTDSCEQNKLSVDSLQGNTPSKYPNVSAREKSMKVDYLPEVTLGSSSLLDVLTLCSCSLQLTNNTDESVAFRINGKGGIVPAKSTYTLIVKYSEGDILLSSVSGDTYVCFEYQSECDEFFEDARKIGNVVHELTLETNFAPQGEATSVAIISPITKIILDVERSNDFVPLPLDAHPTEPLILTRHYKGGHRSDVRLWNYGTQARTMLRTERGAPALSVKFIARKQWFVAGTHDGFIHVYKYGTDIQKITSFEATDYNGIRLAVHPTQSYVMSLSDAGLIKFWDWNMGWKCTRTFEAEQSRLVWPIAFNPEDTNCFVVASNDHTIKVWNLDSSRSNYTLSGHSDKVNCLDFFTRDDRQYLITGSDDCTTKIWDLARKTLVHTLSAFMSPVISVVSLPDLPYIALGSQDGIVQIWNSRNSRLERMVSFGCSRDTPRLYLMETRRLVIIQNGSMAFMDISDEEAVQ